MSVEDVSVAAVVVNSQVSAILLEDIACSCFACTADKFSNMAALEAFNSCTPLFVVPGCTVLQEDIDCTVELFIAAICGIAFILEAIICNTSPYGVCSCQAQVYFSVKLRLISIYSTGRCTYIALQYQLVVSCTYCIVVFIKVNVHAGGARFSNHCIIVVCIILVDFDIAAAVNRQLCMTAVCKQAVTVNLGIDITIDSNLWSHLQGVVAAAVYQGTAIIAKSTFLGGQAPFAVFVAHSGYIAVKGYFGIASCIQAQGITNTLHIELGITVDGQLHRFVLALSALTYVDTFNTTIGTAAVDYQLACINSYAVSRAGAKSINCRTCTRISVKSQGFTLSIYCCSLSQVYRRLVVSSNAAVFSKFIGTVFNENAASYIFTIISLDTSQCSSKFCFYLMIRHYRSSFIVGTLA